jgi:hypothetical protein
MNNEEMNKKMEFIVEHQAKFAAEMEMMRELQAADARRFQNALFGMLDIVGSLTRSQMRTDGTVNSLAEDFSRLTERLNIFINVVERFISGNGDAESSA